MQADFRGIFLGDGNQVVHLLVNGERQDAAGGLSLTNTGEQFWERILLIEGHTIVPGQFQRALSELDIILLPKPVHPRPQQVDVPV